MFEAFHFLQPLWFWALLPLGLLVWLAARTGGTDTAWRRVCDARLLPWLLVEPGTRGRLPAWLLAAGWLITVIALADPVWEKQPQPVYRSQGARVIVLDLSRSMLSPDLAPSRLARARYKVADLLQHSTEGQTGLVVFAGDAFAVSPLTTDAETIQALLKPLEPDLMPAQGSRVDLGLEKAGELLQQAGIDHGDILLVADGSHGGRAIDTAARLHREGYRISVLGIGTPQGAPLPDPRGGYVQDDNNNIVMPKLDAVALRELAAAGGGRYTTITTDDRDIDYLLEVANPRLQSRSEQTDRQTEMWQSRGPWLVLLLLPLAALVFRRGWLLGMVLVIGTGLTTPPPAMASTWDDLWRRRDQQAEQALAAGEHEQAARLAQDPLRRGSAEYRSGDYAAALQSFSDAAGADADYNRGNALAQLGRYREAIAAYEQALHARPGMADAEHNKAEIEKLLQQQEQQEQSAQQEPQQGDDDSAEENPQSGERQQDSEDASGQGSASGAESSPGDDGEQSGADANEKETASAEPVQDSAGQQDQDGNREPQDQSAAAGTDQADGNPEDSAKTGQESRPEDTSGEQPDAATAPENAFETAAKAAATEPDAEIAAAPSSPVAERQLSPLPQEAEQASAGPADRPSPADSTAEPLSSEEQQAAEQWLRRIPDDPGGLLRRKFLYQYSQRPTRSTPDEQPAW
jgi:Ca-activated chloride channel family protein